MRFLNVSIGAIGHLCVDVDCYIKEGVLGLRPKCNVVLLAPKSRVANAHLLDYWGKYLRIVTSPWAHRLLWPLVHIKYTRYNVWKYTEGTRAHAYEIQKKYAGRRPLLSLTDQDLERGRTVMRGLGIPDDAWFVCVHARESGYRPNDNQKYRNSNIDDYLPAIRAIIDRGGWVIRVGDPTMKSILKMDRVVDYVRLPIRSDWMDIFLAGQCKFFLGCASGLYCLAHVFGRPSVTVNKAPLAFVLPHGPGDIGIPKLVWSNEENRYLRFTEIFNSPIGSFRFDVEFNQTGVQVVDNDPKDIEDAVTEMMDRIDGKLIYEALDEELQERFKSLMNPTHYSFGSLSRVGRAFLRKHSSLLK